MELRVASYPRMTPVSPSTAAGQPIFTTLATGNAYAAEPPFSADRFVREIH